MYQGKRNKNSYWGREKKLSLSLSSREKVDANTADNILVNTKTISLFEVKVNSLTITSIKVHKKGEIYSLDMTFTFWELIQIILLFKLRENSKIKISMFNVLGIVCLLVFWIHVFGIIFFQSCLFLLYLFSNAIGTNHFTIYLQNIDVANLLLFFIYTHH